MTLRHIRVYFWLFLLTLSATAGCSSSPVKTELAKPEANLNSVAMAYTDAIQANGNGPANAEQLKKALAVTAPVTGIQPDEVLISPNDGEPFVVIWNIKMNAGGTPIIAYERKGKDGKRLVVDLRKIPYYVTEAEFKKLSFPAGHKPEN